MFEWIMRWRRSEWENLVFDLIKANPRWSADEVFHAALVIQQDRK